MPDFAGGADPSGRFWFDVHASTECTVYGGEWVTPDPPARQVSPSVVFCTYNRVGYLSRIMRALADRKDVYAEISRIYIVNQGDRFELGDLVTGVSEDFLSRDRGDRADQPRWVRQASAAACTRPSTTPR